MTVAESEESTSAPRKRFGDVRVIHELALGERRIDMVFVCRDDIVGVERFFRSLKKARWSR